MKNIIWTLTFVAVSASSFLVGMENSKTEIYEPTQNIVTNLETAAKNQPRGSLGIPSQWFVKESLIGWEKMMLIFGYADNQDVCYNLIDMARKESPNIKFRCEDAN